MTPVGQHWFNEVITRGELVDLVKQHAADTAAAETPTIVLTSAVAWDGITARPQHFARGLAERGWNVLFVDGPITWLSPIKNRDLRDRAWPNPPVRTLTVNPASAGQGAADATGSLRVLSPFATLPFGNMERAINRFNQRLLALQISHAAPGPYILLSMLPGSADLLAFLHPVASVYDCVDLHAQFPGFVRPHVVDLMEWDMVSQSRAVFATAGNLDKRMRQWHANVTLLPNAAQTEHFATTASAPVHPLIRELPSPRITMFGGIGSWIDQTFLCDLADARPHLQIVLVGPIETDVSRLRQKPNIHLLGRQPYGQLPQFLAGSDATLVAFNPADKVAQSVNPVKVYEYLAANREVIATPIPELQKLSDSLWITHTARDAAEAIDRILAGERRMPDATERQAFVDANSWHARVSVIDATLRHILPVSVLAPREELSL
ncbi:glycosyltransferase family protein [Alicyclobacillus sp. ALC3]|uniref:glycosyltransferase family protein n=1 Tax=Alicyclobacillus sp. ALC3 TaxID=2796143 RepID=UPI0023794D31|nr:glycosyltransferase [Alicyclobacillus sp. ALC3]WDL98232.1 glycosyltransferase [Alicyclobacillus sp. ALC3]